MAIAAAPTPAPEHGSAPRALHAGNCVGRERELQKIVDALDDAQHGGIFVALRQDMTPALLWTTIGWAVALAIGVGLVFGLQPAWKAAKTDPIDALRA